MNEIQIKDVDGIPCIILENETNEDPAFYIYRFNILQDDKISQYYNDVLKELLKFFDDLNK